MRREGVRRAGLSCKVGELPYGLGLGKRGGRLLWKATGGGRRRVVEVASLLVKKRRRRSKVIVRAGMEELA